MRRPKWPVIVMVLGVLSLVGWYVVYTRHVVNQLRDAASVQAQMYARIFEALQDTSFSADPTVVLLDLSRQISESGIPLVVTDPEGRVAITANLPSEVVGDSVSLKRFVEKMDERNKPIVQPIVGAVHVGDSAIVNSLQIIPLMQALGLLVLVGFGVYALIERGRAEREKVWAGMAREAAHQLGTPLSSLAGWIELLGDSPDQTTEVRALEAMQQDLQRLERVSHRFERIGRPPRREDVDCNDLVERMASWFAARAPTLARKVTISSTHPEEQLMVHGDRVLLEWVVEVLIKNAIDALGGKDGEVLVSADPLPEGGVRIRVQDNGPGIPRHLRKRIFDAGFSTKERGWGIGLSLARRIVQENHNGKLLLAEIERGAAFDIILPA